MAIISPYFSDATAFGNPSAPQDTYYYSTGLLLHMNGSNGSTAIVDNSPYPRSISVNGNAQISTAQSKFGGSSLLLDGTGDWIYAEPGSAPFGTGDFTVEGWFYWNSIANGGLFHVYPGTPPGTTNGTAVGFDGTQFQIYTGGTNNSQGGSVSIGTWYHVAYVKSNGSVSLYVNGVKQGVSRADTTNYGGNGVNVGLYYSNGFTFPGYIDDFRVTIGVARYTSDFTPPTTQFPDTGPYYDHWYTSVALLLPMNGANGSTTFTDISSTSKTVTAAGNAQISTTQSMFGGSSALFDGTGDYLQLSSSGDLSLGTGDLTIEGWIYLNTAHGFAVLGTLSFNAGASFRINTTLMVLDSSGINSVSRSVSININTWYHVAVTRISGTVRFFLNGVKQGTDQTYTQNFSGESRIIGGSVADNALYMNGYLDDVRITKGVGRYSSNFTPIPRAFPTNTYYPLSLEGSEIESVPLTVSSYNNQLRTDTITTVNLGVSPFNNVMSTDNIDPVNLTVSPYTNVLRTDTVITVPFVCAN